MQRLEAGVAQQTENYIQGFGDRTFNNPDDILSAFETVAGGYLFAFGAGDMGQLKTESGAEITDPDIAAQAAQLRQDISIAKKAIAEVRKRGPATRESVGYLQDIEKRYDIPRSKQGNPYFIEEVLTAKAQELLPHLISHLTETIGIQGRDRMASPWEGGGQKQTGFFKSPKVWGGQGE